MEMLFDVRRGSLYNSDTSFLAEVDYKRISSTGAVFYFYEDPELVLPLTVFFQPMGEKYDNISFAYTLTGCIRDKDDLGELCYKATGTAEGIPEFRDDLRVDVSFPVEIKTEDGRSIEGTVTDLSAGGFMFVSEEEVPLETEVSFMLPLIKAVYITGVIRHRRPTRQKEHKGYGCQFVKLPPATESAIRGFVFQEELIQRRRKVTV